MVYQKVLDKKTVVGENIRRYLEAHNLQQNEFAAQIGMSPQHFSFYARGKREPRENNLNRIAAGFGIDPLELYRIPPGMVDPDFEFAWNCLIELQQNKIGLEIVKDFLTLLVKTDPTHESSDIISAIKLLIHASKKEKNNLSE
ncbi:MAG: XRE family transcriptional regulator [Deltaproteobacteria bacterium]|nr:MAG: XRE family transcriptional regulator [Deltaproteobacteria bacterium]RPI50591.1 MAG: XRE family transcriptional regulator [Deltaproteobacteria bacterium]